MVPRLGILATVVALPAAALAEEGSLISFQPSVLFWTWVTFLVVLAIVWKYAWGPLSQSLHDREERIRKAIEDADAARVKAEELQKQFEDRLEGARAEAEAIIREGRDDAQRVRDRYEKEQREEAEAIKQRALNEIELAKGKALEEIRQEARGLAIHIASKVLQREVDEKDHEALMEDALSGYDRAVRETGGRTG